MRGKRSRGKSSLQKTASSVLNAQTHRNSNISETLPLYYNDSVLSVGSNINNHQYYRCESKLKGKKVSQSKKNRDKAIYSK